MANSVDANEMVRYEPSNPGLYCLQRYRFCCIGLNGLKSQSAIFQSRRI